MNLWSICSFHKKMFKILLRPRTYGSKDVSFMPLMLFTRKALSFEAGPIVVEHLDRKGNGFFDNIQIN